MDESPIQHESPMQLSTASPWTQPPVAGIERRATLTMFAPLEFPWGVADGVAVMVDRNLTD
jgi:hypothetical protein